MSCLLGVEVANSLQKENPTILSCVKSSGKTENFFELTILMKINLHSLRECSYTSDFIMINHVKR